MSDNKVIQLIVDTRINPNGVDIEDLTKAIVKAINDNGHEALTPPPLMPYCDVSEFYPINKEEGIGA